MNTKHEVLTITEAAEYLRLSTKTVRRLITDGQLHAARVGGSVRVRRSDLARMLNSAYEKPAAN